MRTLKAQETTIKIRISKADKELLQHAAGSLGLAVSNFIRIHSLAAANQCKQSD